MLVSYLRQDKLSQKCLHPRKMMCVVPFKNVDTVGYAACAEDKIGVIAHTHLFSKRFKMPNMFS